MLNIDMYKALIFLSVQAAFSLAADSLMGSITATNGGVVQLGNTLTLSYESETNWTTCFWYRHDTPTRYQYCIFIRAEGQLEKTCSLEAFKDRLEIQRGDANTCSIQILNVTKEDNATWSAKVDAELTNKEINVSVVVKPEKLVIESAPIEAGTYGKVSCQVTGGQPTPLMLNGFEDIPGVPYPEFNATTTQSVDGEGRLALDSVIIIKPKVTDYNRKVYCAAVQKVDDEQLSEPLTAQSKLNVTFQPLTRHDGLGSEENPLVFGNEVGKDLEVNIQFFANPRPVSVVWEFAEMNDTNEVDGGNSNNAVPAGTSTDRYVASELIDNSDISFTSKLIIKRLEETDQAIAYRLVVNNTIGSNVYNFKVVLQDPNTITDQITTSSVIIEQEEWVVFVSLWK